MENRTSIEFFNYYYREFLNNLVSTYPDFKKPIVGNYRTLLEGNRMDVDKYVKHFMSRTRPFLNQIDRKNAAIFQNDVYLLEGVNFNTLWTSQYSTDENKSMVWKYLLLLSRMAKLIMPGGDYIKNLLQSVEQQCNVQNEVSLDLPFDANSVSAEVQKEEDKEDGPGLLSSAMNMVNNMGGLGNVSESVNMAANIGNMVKSLSEGLGGMMNNMPMPTPSSTSEPQLDENGNPIEAETMGTTGTTEATGTTETNNSSGMAGIFNENGLFGELAEEMTSTFNFDNVEADETSSPQDIFGKFMSGDNPAKFVGLVQKFGSKLQNEISSGRIDQGQLLRDTMQMMGQMPGMASAAGQSQPQQTSNDETNVTQEGQEGQEGQVTQGTPDTTNTPSHEELLEQAQQMFGNNRAAMNRFNNNSRSNRARARLRKKLEQKRARQQQKK